MVGGHAGGRSARPLVVSLALASSRVAGYLLETTAAAPRNDDAGTGVAVAGESSMGGVGRSGEAAEAAAAAGSKKRLRSPASQAGETADAAAAAAPKSILRSRTKKDGSKKSAGPRITFDADVPTDAKAHRALLCPLPLWKPTGKNPIGAIEFLNTVHDNQESKQCQHRPLSPSFPSGVYGGYIIRTEAGKYCCQGGKPDECQRAEGMVGLLESVVLSVRRTYAASDVLTAEDKQEMLGTLTKEERTKILIRGNLPDLVGAAESVQDLHLFRLLGSKIGNNNRLAAQAADNARFFKDLASVLVRKCSPDKAGKSALWKTELEKALSSAKTEFDRAVTEFRQMAAQRRLEPVYGLLQEQQEGAA